VILFLDSEHIALPYGIHLLLKCTWIGNLHWWTFFFGFRSRRVWSVWLLKYIVMLINMAT